LVAVELAKQTIMALATQEVTLCLVVLLLMVAVAVVALVQAQVVALVVVVAMQQAVAETPLVQVHRKEIMVGLVELVQTTVLVAVAVLVE
jgi:hypothetical protein